MTAKGWFQIALFLLVVFLITKPLGIFMARVFSGQKTFLDPVLRPIEKIIYRLTGVDENHEMSLASTFSELNLELDRLHPPSR